MEASASFAKLAAVLRERLEVIGDRAARETDPAAHLERLQRVSEQIAQLQKQLPANIHPQLKHYLDRCSYDKALAFLEEEFSGAR